MKVRKFTVVRFLGNNYKDQIERYTGGALAIFLQVPVGFTGQRRFHSHAQGRWDRVGEMTCVYRRGILYRYGAPEMAFVRVVNEKIGPPTGGWASGTAVSYFPSSFYPRFLHGVIIHMHYACFRD